MLKVSGENEPSSTMMGTLAWSERQAPYDKGRLTNWEKVRLFGNVARMGLLEAKDQALYKFGRISRTEASLEDLLPPQTALVEDSLSFARETHSKSLLDHSWRTYYFGALLGRYAKLDVDRELLFAAAILHDTGLVKERPVDVSACCFAVAGGKRSRDHLISCGHCERKARGIGDAISLHMNLYVSARTHGAVAHLLSRGAMCDVFSLGARRIGRSSLQSLMSKHPRSGLIQALEIETAEHLSGTRPAVMGRLSGGKMPKTAFDRFGK
ncbi:HD domain-containing protein [Flexibacterium corallicola]|uniref:HD domain-containing protein n=1 Tax=Flexibacterium corallicola TaxID=3037259 RepID=UPI00286F3B41|nr:HD domain-containing protein [Pseudovibrio sp. M1P-2-3]